MQTSSDKINKSWRGTIQHKEYIGIPCFTVLSFIDLFFFFNKLKVCGSPTLYDSGQQFLAIQYF